jgi:hypothetical protein
MKNNCMDKTSLHLEGDMEKDVPILSPDIVSLEEADPQATVVKMADLIHNKLYTVVPKQHDLATGIQPEIQHFNRKYVFLWDDYSSLNIFSDARWKKITVHLPEGLRNSRSLTKLVGDVYALPEIPSSWHIEEQPTPPRHVE